MSKITGMVKQLFCTCCIVVVLFCNCTSAVKDSAVLLFNGEGVSPNDVTAISDILDTQHIDYTLVNSTQLDGLDSNQLKKYKLMIVPGGNFIVMGKGLHAATTRHIRQAVHAGLNYLGICAGGFLAGDTRNNSFDLLNGVQFKFYAAEDSGTRKAAVAIANADGSTIEQYWEDGPHFSGWGTVVSKYPNGTAATVQGNCGAGWVVLTGVHPEAPASWRRAFYFNTSIEESHGYAAMLIRAALEKKLLPQF